jgi:hypothetical protein
MHLPDSNPASAFYWTLHLLQTDTPLSGGQGKFVTAAAEIF